MSDGATADLIVVGGGIAGLVAARRAALAGASVVVLEGGDDIGGMLRAATLGGDGSPGVASSPDVSSAATAAAAPITIDIGAEAFATRGGAVERWLDELGLGADVVAPETRGSWGHADGEAYPLPKTGLLGIPAHAAAPDVRAAIGIEGAARAAADATLTPDVGERAASLAELARIRMGERVVDRLVAPVARGVYSTDPELLD
ncbi:MAG: NAD(P)-binding protein, partial [Pseudoclavibacter sp.]